MEGEINRENLGLASSHGEAGARGRRKKAEERGGVSDRDRLVNKLKPASAL